MPKLAMIFLALFICLGTSSAQKKHKKIKSYKAWIKQIDTKVKTKGLFYAATDSSIIILDPKSKDSIKTEILITDIQLIKIRRKNKIGAGAIIGGSIGFSFGVAGIVVSGLEDSDPGQELVIGAIFGLVFGGIGAAIGAGIGSLQRTYLINGDRNKYHSKFKPKLLPLSLKYQKGLQQKSVHN